MKVAPARTRMTRCGASTAYTGLRRAQDAHLGTCTSPVTGMPRFAQCHEAI